MRFKFLILIIIFFLKIQFSFSQADKITTVCFTAKFGNSSLFLNDVIYLKNSDDSIKIESLKFYISNFEFLDNDKSMWQEKNSFHLVDISNDRSMKLLLKTNDKVKFNKIKFNLGIDSSVNVSGAMGGDLDPTKGMYWAWQSGYINFKLEGKSKKCNTRNNEFHFHLGGYATPYSAIRSITLNVSELETINITLDLEKMISEIDLSKQNKIMSPSFEAVLLSKKVSQLFSVQQP
jgi:hypothetical protein